MTSRYVDSKNEAALRGERPERKPYIRRRKHVAQTTRQKLRCLYQGIWHREWPWDDLYLDQLWYEELAVAREPVGRGYHPSRKTWDGCLTSMRECHPF